MVSLVNSTKFLSKELHQLYTNIFQLREKKKLVILGNKHNNIKT